MSHPESQSTTVSVQTVPLRDLVDKNPSGLRWDGQPYGYRTSGDNLADYRAERTQERITREALALAESGQRFTEADVLAWRGDYGSTLSRREDRMWLFHRPDGYVMPEYKVYEVDALTFGGVMRKAAALDAQALPVDFVDPPLRRRALALRQVVRSGWTTARKRARKLDVPFSITPRQTDALLWRQKMKCVVSGVDFAADKATGGSYRSPFRPSLDRIKSSLGYEPGNIRLVLTLVNLAMNDWGAQPLIEIAHAIAAKHPRKPQALR